MTPDQLTNAIVTGIGSGGEQFLEGTLAAVLPIMWLAIMGLQLGRPYILDMIDRFTLRLGADLLWLIYVALRDLLIVSGVVMSFMFFFPDVVVTDQLPLTGGLAACALFGVLLVKLMGDPDHNLRDFRITFDPAGGRSRALLHPVYSRRAVQCCRDGYAGQHQQLPGHQQQPELGRWHRLRLNCADRHHGRFRRRIYPHYRRARRGIRGRLRGSFVAARAIASQIE